MELLESVNMCLHALGETRVTSTNTRNPSVDLILETIKTKKKLLLERGWWFNVFPVTLYPGADGRIAYPAQTLRMEAQRAGKAIYTRREDMLFDALNNTSIFTAPVDLIIGYDVDFEDLPESVASVITYRVMRAVYVGDLGNDSSVSDMMQNEQIAYLQMETQHLRNMKYNTRGRREFARYMTALSG